MKILMVHKFYFIEGGGERYMFNLSSLLQRHGDEIIPFAMQHPRNYATPYDRYFVSYFEPDGVLGKLNLINGIKSAARVIYNVEARRSIERLISATRPDIAHVHGVYHHLSPSVLFSLKKFGLPVVFTLHEYKILCPSYLFLDRFGRICERCAGAHFWHPLTQRCLKNSFAVSALISAEAYVHRFLKTYHRNVDLYLSPSKFLRGKMIEYGFPEEKIVWLPYTIPIQEYEPAYTHGRYFTYVGRLSREKGIELLVRAMREVKGADLHVCGTGRLADSLEKYVREHRMSNVHFRGYLSGEELRSVIRGGMFTVVPSVVYDNSPLAIYESFALGKPVIGARIGGIPELIDEGVDGMLFEANDSAGLTRAIDTMVSKSDALAEMGRAARKKAETLFAPESHQRQISKIYNSLLGSHAGTH